MMSTPTACRRRRLRAAARRFPWRARHQAEFRGDRAAHADQAGLAVFRLRARRIELVMHRGRAEIPQDGFAGAGQQRPAAQLVAFPFADLGRGQIADVVDVEHQQRAELGILQRLLGAAKPVLVQPLIIDALLEIDAGDAERRQRAAPIVARVDVLGADFTDGLVHGSSPSRELAGRPYSRRFGRIIGPLGALRTRGRCAKTRSNPPGAILRDGAFRASSG
jgi:hypothetical protein